MLDPLVHAQTLTLTPSNYNGNNISCFGAQDGSINLTISGVTPPYTIRWSNDATTEDLSNLPAGYYNVEVDDTIPSTEALQAEITLTEPEALGIELTVSDYLVNARHYTISLNGACNGSITPSVGGGTAPYTYNWEPYGQTTANLTNICAGDYNLNVTDANGCAAPAQQDMTEPERDDWQMNGNTGTNPATQFIGTTDNKDLVFKTNGITRFNLKGNGDIKLNGFAGTGPEKFLYADNDGVLQSHNFKIITPQPFVYCNGNNYIDVLNAWQYNGTNFTNLFNCWQRFGFGTPNPRDVIETKSAIRITSNTDDNDYVRIQHDGGNSCLDTYGAGDFNINTYSPKNVNIATGNSGNVTLGGNNYLAPDGGKFVNIGSPSNSNYKLNVGGEINATGLRINGTALSLSSQWQASGNDIYFNSGNVGISTTSPDMPLVVNGNTRLLADASSDINGFEFKSGNSATPTRRGITLEQDLGGSNNYGGFNFWINNWQNANGSCAFNFKEKNNNTSLMSINASGKISIHTSGSSNELSLVAANPTDPEIGSSTGTILFWKTTVNYNKLVCGGLDVINNSGGGVNFRVNQDGLVQARSFKVTLSTFADFVFNKDYKLMPLKELEEYLTINKHLPEIPTEKELAKDGLDVGIMFTKAFQKIEELTLYAIDAKKENEQLKQENAEIKKELHEIKTKLNKQ